MRVLVACEFSGVVRDAFIDRGHSARSCDFLSGEGRYVSHHMKRDVLGVLNSGWDLMIAFPPCTHLAVSGARWFPEKIKDGRQQRGVDFFMSLANAPIGKICIENPVGIMSTVWRKPDIIIQPWMFGEDASKKTCLWLKNLPKLKATSILKKKRYANQTPSGQNKLGPSEDRAKLRSITYRGVADAMAQQWG